MGNPFPVSLPSESRKASKIVRDFTSADRVDQVVPASVLRRAKGFAIFSVFRIGFLMSARGGAGVVVARLPDGTWSPPAAIGLGGLGGGFNAGAEVTDFLIVLTSRRAVSTFMSTGSLQLGGNMALALGPLGRAAEAGGSVSSEGKLAAMLSYSKSKGLYGGISLEGTILMDRADANAKAYGPNASARSILSGNVEAPEFAIGLMDVLNRVSGRPAEGEEYYDDGSSVLSPTSSTADSFASRPGYGNAGYGGSGGYGSSSARGAPGGARRSRDPFGDSDEELVPPRAARQSGWRNQHSHESRAQNERQRMAGMDDLDRELQQGATGPSHHKAPSSRAGSSVSANGKAWSNNYSFDGGRGTESTPSARASGGYGHGSGSGNGHGRHKTSYPSYDSSDDDSYAPRRVQDYEADLSPHRATTRESVVSSIGQEGNGTTSRSTNLAGAGAGVGDETLVMAKFAYQPASNETDISFKAGDVIRVTKRTGSREEWWSGECHGKLGWFPANYTVDL